MVRGEVEWGCTEIDCENQIPYVSREECSVNEAAFEEEIGDDIQKGARARKFKSMGHVCARFQAALVAKESVKFFMQQGEDVCVWGYCDGIVLWHMLDRQYGDRKW